MPPEPSKTKAVKLGWRPIVVGVAVVAGAVAIGYSLTTGLKDDPAGADPDNGSGLDVIQGMEQLGAVKDVSTHVDFRDFPLLRRGVLLFDNADELAVCITQDSPQPGRILLMRRSQDACRPSLPEQ